MLPHYSIPRTKACQSCWTAKAKCEPDSDYTKCKRCNHHGLECVLRETFPRKRRKQIQSDEDQGERDNSRMNKVSTDSMPTFSPLELELGIHFYRSLLSQYFPFVIIPEISQGIGKFSKDKPFLSLVVAMLGCTHDRSRQRALAKASRKYLAEHLLERGEKTLDLLQGLLLKIHWYQLQFELPKQRSVFIHLAMALVVDLELNKSPLGRSRHKNVVEAETGFDMPINLTDHNLDEKRAFLGCLYLSSVISKCAAHMDGVRFSDHAERCCEYLEASQTCSDQDVVRMLRLQQTVERFETARISFSRDHWTKGSIFDVQSNALSQAEPGNVMAFVNHWERELGKYWSEIPEGTKSDLLRVQHEHAKLCLYEISFEESWFSSDVHRLKVLHKCLAAIKALNTVFLPVAQQPAILLNVPSHVFAQSSHAIFAAVQLCSIRYEGWSYKLVEQELNLMHVFDVSVDSIDYLMSSYLPSQVPEFFYRIALSSKSTKKWYTDKLRTWDEGDPLRETTDKAHVQEHDVDLDFLGQFLDLDDNLWLQNLLSPDESLPPMLAL